MGVEEIEGGVVGTWVYVGDHCFFLSYMILLRIYELAGCGVKTCSGDVGGGGVN